MPDFVIHNLEFVDRVYECDSVYTLRFAPLDDLGYQAGQYAHLGFPSPQKDNNRVHHMSFASAPSDPFVEFTMDLGSGSPYKTLMSDLTIGAKAIAFKIKGEFTLSPPEQREVVFVGGGVGMAPIRSLLRDLEARKLPTRWTLLQVARSGFVYQKELEGLPGRQWRVNHAGLDAVWDQVTGHFSNPVYYVCGSDRFVQGLSARLLDSGVAADHIVAEDFR